MVEVEFTEKRLNDVDDALMSPPLKVRSEVVALFINGYAKRLDAVR